MKISELEKLLSRLEALVREAGQAALGHWGAIAAETKADSSLVTEVDRRTESFLADSLTELLPGSDFAGEEYGRRGANGILTWICDPIDGTTNFVRGLPHWCVSVGLLHEGNPVLGIVHAPALGLTYAALAGCGACCNGRPLQAGTPTELAYEDLVCVSTSALKTLDTSRLVCRLRCLGSIALEMCLVAEGKAVAAIGIGEGMHDLAASLCICGEAGAGTYHLDGSSLDVGALLDRWRTTSHFVVAASAALRLLGDVISVRSVPGKLGTVLTSAP